MLGVRVPSPVLKNEEFDMAKFIQKPREAEATQWFPGVHITRGKPGIDYRSG